MANMSASRFDITSVAITKITIAGKKNFGSRLKLLPLKKLKFTVTLGLSVLAFTAFHLLVIVGLSVKLRGLPGPPITRRYGLISTPAHFIFPNIEMEKGYPVSQSR